MERTPLRTVFTYDVSTWIDKLSHRPFETHETHIIRHDVSILAQRKDITDRKHLGGFFLEFFSIFGYTLITVKLFDNLSQHMDILDIFVSEFVQYAQHVTRLFLFGVKVHVSDEYFRHDIEIILLEIVKSVEHFMLWNGFIILLEFEDASQSKKTVISVHHQDLGTVVIFFVEFSKVHPSVKIMSPLYK